MKFFCTVFLFCFFISCTSNPGETKKEEATEQTVTDTVSAPSTDSSRTIVNRSMIWSVQPESSEKEKLKAPEHVRLDTFSSAHLVQLINQNFPDIKLDLLKVSNDTIYVKIPDSRKLTEEIGNTGAENYLAATTYTLTELKNIRFVNIQMEPGEHAEPGVYSREDFKNLR